MMSAGVPALVHAALVHAALVHAALVHAALADAALVDVKEKSQRSLRRLRSLKSLRNLRALTRTLKCRTRPNNAGSVWNSASRRLRCVRVLAVATVYCPAFKSWIVQQYPNKMRISRRLLQMCCIRLVAASPLYMRHISQAEPCIYWRPLSDEEIQAKQAGDLFRGRSYVLCRMYM